MREPDFVPFAALLDDVWGLKGQALTAGQKTIFFRALTPYPLAAVRAGLDAHVRDPERGRFLPMPADIIAQINSTAADDGRPGAEEAWAIAVRGADEAATVVWTSEVSAAWAIAKPVFDLGDEVGARMAFKEAYVRLVAESRTLRMPAQWLPSLGHDAQRRAVALSDAVVAGLLPAPAVAGLLPPPEESSGEMPPNVLAALRGLRDRLASAPDAPSQDALSKQATAEAKRLIASRVDEYQQGRSA